MADGRTTILLVEDNPDDALLIQEMLADADGGSFVWIHAERLSEGLEELAAGRADVVLLDLSLPDSHGLETFATAHSQAPETPIILLTGLDDEELAVQAVQLGAQDYLSKSRMEGQLLVRSLRYAIERQTLLAELVRQSDELARLNEDLRRSNAELEQFAYVASHDLQEPLRMVSSYVEILAEDYSGRLDADADRFIGYVVDGATRMKGLINDLLTYSRVGTQGKSFGPADCNLIVERVLMDQARALEECGGTVTYMELPVVMADDTQLTQLLQNLLSNALKYRRDVAPRVHVCAEERPDAWAFSVSDNGIGIAPRHSERIFQMFQRLHHRSEYPGSGIGLAVCQKIVERHGGRIWVESEPGKGSTFHFTISTLLEEEADHGSRRFGHQTR